MGVSVFIPLRSASFHRNLAMCPEGEDWDRWDNFTNFLLYLELALQSSSMGNK